MALAARNLCDGLSVQDYWNVLELAILDGVECCAPLTEVKMGKNGHGSKIPSSVKNKLNIRKRLLRLDRKRFNSVNAPHIKILNKEINDFFSTARADRVRLAAMGICLTLFY